jgi:hypothetical protein
MAQVTVYFREQAQAARLGGKEKTIDNVLTAPITDGHWLRIVANPHEYFFPAESIAGVECEGTFGRVREMETAGQR